MRVIASKTEASNSTDFVFSIQNMIFGFTLVRAVILIVIYSGITLLQVMQGDFLNPSLWQPVNLWFMLAFAAQILLIESYPSLLKAKQLLSFLFFFDALLIAGLLSSFGFFHSLFLFFSLVNIVFSGFLLESQSTWKLSLWSAVLVNLVLSFNHQFDPSSLQAVFVTSNISLLLVAALSVYLGRKVRYISNELAEQSSTIETLTNINELIVDNIPSGLLVVSHDFNIERANKGALKIFSDISLENKQLAEVSSKLEGELRQLKSQLKRNTAQRLEIETYNIKSEKMTLETIVSLIPGANELESKYLCLLQNVTEIKNLELAMRQKEKLAAVGQLAAGIAHEIRNPLASISGSVQLLQANLDVQTPEDKKLLAIMVKEIDRLNNLITEFLDYVRPELTIEDPIQINSLITEVMELLKLNDRLPKNVNQRKELRAQLLIYGQYDKLKQAILNILINSYQAMGDTLRPEIYVQTYDAEDQVVVIIQDNGSGISKENLKRVFEPFHTTKASGTGLGLAITHKILEGHNAVVRVDSELGQGTKFSIVFPADKSPDSNRIYLKKQA